MDARAERFLSLSVDLTGFSRLELAGTGMTADYLAALDDMVPAGLLDTLLERWNAAGHDSVLHDATLGPLARNIVLLWYCGTWTPLSNDPRRATHAAVSDVRVISARAYRAGLQWVAAGAHAAGAAPQGYGAWTLPPAAATP